MIKKHDERIQDNEIIHQSDEDRFKINESIL
jgi:hypothetical protein